MKYETAGLNRVEDMIQVRIDRLHKDYEELQLLKQRKSEILKNKERTERVWRDWDMTRVKNLLDSGMPRKQMAAILGVKYHTLNSYIWRMREKGEDI